MINKPDVKLIQKALHKEEVDEKELEKVIKKLDIIVRKFEIEDEANDKLVELEKEYNELDK